MSLNLRSNDGSPVNYSNNANPYNDLPAPDFYDLESNNVYTVSNQEAKSSYKASKRRAKGSFDKAIKTLITVAILAALVYGAKWAYNKYLRPADDITHLMEMNEEDIATKLNTTFVDAPELVSSVQHYAKKGEFTVRKSDKGVSVIYIDGKQIGVKVESDKYIVYGLQVNGHEYNIDKNSTYRKEDFFTVINDEGAKTESFFYYNTDKNDCLVVLTSNADGRILSITYYNDYRVICEDSAKVR